MQVSDEASLFDRIIAVASYFTAGMAGFIWLIIKAFMKFDIPHFLMYHIMQSIFLSMLYMVVMMLCSLVYKIIYFIPVLNAIPFYLNMPIPLFFNWSIIQTFTSCIWLYLIVTSFLGFYSYLPWVSNIISSMLPRR